jgi:Uma2 family endonuclease
MLPMATAESEIAAAQPHAAAQREPLASPAIYRMTVDEYERMEGVLDDPRVELIAGYLVRKIGKHAPHVWAVTRLLKALIALLPAGWTWRKEDPIRIPDFDEPEPDITILRGSDEDYRNRVPDAKDATLVVEVSESTLARDRGDKRIAYARGKIPTYWIVNLVDRCIELHTGPGPDGYASCIRYTADQAIPVVIDGVQVGSIAVSEILP